MAYSSTNPPVLVSQPFGSRAGGLWTYLSSHDVASVAASSFFSNGYSLGMQSGDFIGVVQMSSNGGAGAYTAHALGIVTTVTSGAGATVVFTATST